MITFERTFEVNHDMGMLHRRETGIDRVLQVILPALFDRRVRKADNRMRRACAANGHPRQRGRSCLCGGRSHAMGFDWIIGEGA